MADEQIPVIDISSINEISGTRIVDAVHKWGFAFIKGSDIGFTASLIDRMFELVRHGSNEIVLRELIRAVRGPIPITIRRKETLCY